MGFQILITEETIRHLLGIAKEDIALVSLKYSNRARRLIFRPSIGKGLEIVLPKSHNEKQVLQILGQYKSRMEEQIQAIKNARMALRPTSVTLPATAASWQIVYGQHEHHAADRIVETPSTLYIPQKADTVFGVPEILQRWLQGKAIQYLPNRLSYVSVALKSPYKSLRIKHQKTRWGSCSIKGNINLNRNLMLMPFELMDYVLHHELVHLKILNHSPKFWKEVSRVFPAYKETLSQLKQWETTSIPEWATI